MANSRDKSPDPGTHCPALTNPPESRDRPGHSAVPPTPPGNHTPRELSEGPIRSLKARARLIHREVQVGDPAALMRARSLSEFRGTNDAAIATSIRRRHCLQLVAHEFGFRSWPHASAVLSGQVVDDYGALLYPQGASAHGNVWLASYAAAAAIRKESGGYLLAYQRHYFIVDRYFIETLGLDPEDADWAKIGRDWARPIDPAARTRLYGRLISRRAVLDPVL